MKFANAILGGGFLVLTLMLVLRMHRVEAGIRVEAEQFENELLRARARLQEARSQIQEIRHELPNTQPEIASAEDHTRIQSRIVPLGNARWEDGTPFVDFPKAVLDRLHVSTLNEDGVTAEVAALLSLSLAEIARVNELCNQTAQQIQELERGRLHRTKDHVFAARQESGRLLTFRIPNYPIEAQEAKRSLQANLEQALGAQRGRLFFAWMEKPSFRRPKREIRMDGQEARITFVYAEGSDRPAKVFYESPSGKGSLDYDATASVLPERWRSLITEQMLHSPRFDQ